MDPASGTVFFNGGFDIDDYPLSNATITLQVTATNSAGNNETAFMNINIVDVNDNAPQVASDLLTLFVDKNSPAGTLIGYIDARDRDRGANAQLVYDVVDSTLSSNSVQITPSGALYTNASLSDVVEPSARLEVRVSDRGLPPLSTSVGVFIIFVVNTPLGASKALLNTGNDGVRAEVTPVATVTIVLLAVAIAASAFAYVCGRKSARRQSFRGQENADEQPDEQEPTEEE